MYEEVGCFMVTLDYLTLSTVIGVLSIITVIILTVLMKTNSNEKGIEMWLHSAVLSIVGFLILFFKPMINVYSIFINNTCALTAMLFIFEGVLRFRGIGSTKKRRRFLWLAIGFFAVISFLNKAHATTRYMFYDMLMIIMFIGISYFFIHGVKGTERKIAYLFVGSFVLMGIGFAYRWTLTVLGVFGDEVVPKHVSVGFLFFLTIVWITLYLFSLLLIINYRSQMRLIKISETDPLTGLYNRRKLVSSIQEFIEMGQSDDAKYILYLFDINGFKHVNDTYGHVFGDHVLMALAGIIESYTRIGDFAARYGGDEFVVVLERDHDDIIKVEALERLRSHIEAPFMYEGFKITLKISMGYVVIDNESTSIEEVLSKADSSMYLEKNLLRELTLVEEI